MITYSTKFPIKESLDKKTFVEMVIKWNQGSKYDKFDSLDWDGESFSTSWEDNDKKLIIDELVPKGVIASRFQKEDEHGLWKTDFILNYDKKYLTVRVALETTEFTTDFYPNYYPPFFVKQVIYWEYAGEDVCLPVDQEAHCLDAYKSNIDDAVYEFSNQVMRLDIDTWEGIQNEKLHFQNGMLLSDRKILEEENAELYEVFEEQLSKTEEANQALNREIQRLTIENQALRMRLVSRDQQPLKECLAPYKKNLPKKGEVIATKIMQHCFIYLMSAKCPVIKVADEDQTYNINEMFDERIKKESEKIEFEIGNEKFSLLHTQIEDAAFGASKLYLYANDRMVQEINLEKEIVDLDKNLFSAKGYYYAGILSGKFLDENVGTNRTSFDISDTAEDESEISMDDIISNVAQNVQIYLSDYLSEVKGKKEERVRTYIKDEAPQYGHLLKYMREDVEAIKPYLPDSKLDDELYKIKRKFDNQLKKDNLDIIKTLEVGATSLDSYQEKFQKQFAKISEANKASLAEYVAHRKVILELLKKGIQSDDFGKYSKEAYIHNLIYPMRRTSDEIEYQAHNLWLIDERLAYCEYVSSDIPFDNNPREDRTDVMILDKPVAVSDEPNTGREYETIVILELKKPMRNDYTQAENPIIQMLGYVDKISSNEMKDKNGRLIKTGTNTQFYLYAVCDITSKLRKIAEDFDFIETPDKRGMYKYHDKKRAYIEILSFDKIIDDAGKRNRILFEKLGI